ncbi:fibrobacter succinogenes major paralogous domain-containing protein [Echinicola pacifica]|nr:fibrobacter succinogenes major paralogous domain-containing protein [Echinicola pacifica]
MKKNLIYFLALVFLTAACVQEESDSPEMGRVSFSKIVFDAMEAYSPSSKVSASSSWEHVLPETATLLITNNSTGDEYSLEYSPKNLLAGAEIVLPFGEYTYYTKVWGPSEAKFLPYTINGEFELATNDLDLTVYATTKFGLITLDATNVSEAHLDGNVALERTEDGAFYYLYIVKENMRTLSVVENFNQNTLQQSITLKGFHHYHFQLELDEDESGVNLIHLNLGEFYFDFDNINIVGDGELVEDADGNSYETVKIGDQYWMAENLRASTYCNGESIAKLDLPMKWEDNKETEFVLVREDSYTDAVHYYYPEAVAKSEDNICPCGWRVGTDEDWLELESFLGMPESEFYQSDFTNQRGSNAEIADKMMAVDWKDIYPGDIREVFPNNSSKFTAYPAGGVDFEYDSDNYFHINRFSVATWHSVSDGSSLLARALFPFANGVYDGSGISRSRSRYGKYLPIRCVKE